MARLNSRDTLPEALVAFLTYLRVERQYSPHTLTAYQNDLVQFGAFIQDTLQLAVLHQPEALAQLPNKAFRRWLASLGPVKRSTQHRKLSSVRRYAAYWQRQGVLAFNPVQEVHLPKQPKRLPTVLAPEVLSRGFSERAVVPASNPAPNSASHQGAFDRALDHAILELLYATGMRRAELISLTASAIDWQAKRVSVLGKGNKRRWVPIGQPALQALKAYREAAEAHGLQPDTPFFQVKSGKPLYPNRVYRAVQAFLKELGQGGKASPHVLRHSFATHLISRGADLNAVKELLGHASLAATQVYVHADAQRLKSVHEHAHPKGEPLTGKPNSGA